MSKLRYILFSVFGALIGAFIGNIALMNYGGNNGCFAVVNSITGLRGYESCDILGLFVGFLLGGMIGYFIAKESGK